jgi:hypothetical protein
MSSSLPTSHHHHHHYQNKHLIITIIITAIIITIITTTTTIIIIITSSLSQSHHHLLKARWNVVKSSIIAGFEQQSKVTLIRTNRISSVFWVSNDNSSLCCTILL